jgi:hypothetical protein
VEDTHEHQAKGAAVGRQRDNRPEVKEKDPSHCYHPQHLELREPLERTLLRRCPLVHAFTRTPLRLTVDVCAKNSGGGGGDDHRARQTSRSPACVYMQFQTLFCQCHCCWRTSFPLRWNSWPNAKAERTRPASAASGSEDPFQAYS